jgi:hypothetical protein
MVFYAVSSLYLTHSPQLTEQNFEEAAHHLLFTEGTKYNSYRLKGRAVFPKNVRRRPNRNNGPVAAIEKTVFSGLLIP